MKNRDSLIFGVGFTVTWMLREYMSSTKTRKAKLRRTSSNVYGTIDEYLTGENDKAVKNVWRFPSDDRMILEVHDLAIGEENTKVVEVTFTRSEK